MMVIARALTCAFALCAALPAGCKKESAAKDQVRPVRITVVSSVGGQSVRNLSGVTEAGVESRLSFKVSGTVGKLPVKVGATVKKGNTIATIDAVDYELALQQARANTSSAVAQRRNADSEYKRIQRLYENQNATRSQLDSARAAFETARAQAAAASKAASAAKMQVNYTRLSAPTDGTISQVLVEVNENVASGQPIVFLTSGDQANVKVAVPESMIAGIVKGAPVQITIDAMGGKSVPGKVIEVGVSSGPGTTFPVTIEIDEANAAIRPGMATSVAFVLGDAGTAERIVLPPAAVAEDRDGRFVYRLMREGADSKFGVAKRVPVEIGDLIAEGLVIKSGVERGWEIIAAGVTRITAEMRVRILDADKPATDKPASDKPASDKPASDKPASDDSAPTPADKPATEK